MAVVGGDRTAASWVRAGLERLRSAPSLRLQEWTTRGGGGLVTVDLNGPIRGAEDLWRPSLGHTWRATTYGEGTDR